MLFSSLILGNDVNKEMLESCKELVKDKTQTNNKMFESCNKILKTEKIKEENKRTYRLGVKTSGILNYGISGGFLGEYLFFKQLSLGVFLGGGDCLITTCKKDTGFMGELYISINLTPNNKYIRTGFVVGASLATAKDNEVYPIISYFFGFKLWNLIDLTVSAGLPLFTLQAGINF
jgi:uncharacterized ferredoxin-like protein